MMAHEEETRPQSAEEISDITEVVPEGEIPGSEFIHHVSMDELYRKLIQLNYLKSVKELGIRRLNRHYFSTQTNPGEQFHQFTNLAAWLIRKCGKPFEQPHEYDDPNAVIASILDALRQTGSSVDFPPNKLKPGCGEHVVYVLSKLADVALKLMKEKPVKPVYQQEPGAPVRFVDEEDELEILEDFQLEPDFDGDDEDAATNVDQEDIEENALPVDEITNHNVDAKMMLLPILESHETTENWKLEVERVLPQLKITIATNNRDWRSRLEQMVSHRKGIEDALSTTKVQLDKLQEEISQVLEKIGNRERYLNTQLDSIIAQYRSVEDEFLRVSEKFKSVSTGVTQRSHTLASVTEELEAVKQEMESTSSSMTDGTPLVNLKKAITKLQNEVKIMDIRIGVLEHSLMQARLRDKSQLLQDMNAPSISI